MNAVFLTLSLIGLCFGPMELWGEAATSRTVFRPEGGLVLKGSTAREKGVLEVIVEQAANGGHIDVCKSRESS